MENFIKEHDYAILVYAKEDTAKYTAADTTIYAAGTYWEMQD